MRLFGPVAVAAILLAPQAAAACTCVRAVPVDEEPLSFVQRAQARGALFLGTALTLRTQLPEAAEGEVGPVVRDVTFAVHRSWNGVAQDTVTVSSSVVGTCGSYFVPGMTYLVVGDISGGGATTGICDFTFSAGHQTAIEAQEELPGPSWVAAPVGRRSIDANLTRIGAPQPSSGSRRLVSLSLPARDDVDMTTYRVEVADTSASFEWHGRLMLELAEGFYRIRLKSPSGRSFDTDLWVRCDESSAAPDICTVVRLFEPGEAWWGDA